MADIGQYLSADYWRTHRLELSYGLVGLTLFVAFSLATFPYDQALKSVLAPMGLRFTAASQSIAIPVGARLNDVRISSAAEAGAPPVFESDSMHVAPAILPILLFRPGLNATANAYGGTIHVIATRRGSGTALSFDARGVHLDEYRALRQMVGAMLGGELTAVGDLELSPDSPATDSGEVKLTGNHLMLRIAGPMPPIRIGDLSATLKLDRGTIQIGELKTSGGDITVNGRGTIRLAPDWHESALSGEFSLTPAPQARTRMGFLFSLLPHPPGTQPYTLGGTIAAPTLI